MLKVVLMAAGLAFVILRVILPRLTGSLTPPARIRLVATRATGSHASELAKRRPELAACGFRMIGTYKVDPMRGLVLTAFTHREHAMCAVVYGHPVVKCFVDLVCKAEDDRSLTVTTAPAGRELDQRDGHEKIFDPGLTIAGMLDIALRRRPQGPYEQWNAGNFAAKFESAYAREMDWRRSRGGVTREEVKRAADASGRKLSEAQIDEATRRLQKGYNASSHGGAR